MSEDKKEWERTTILLKRVPVLPSKLGIKQLLTDVQGFQEVEDVKGRTIIVKHDSGSKDQIVDEVKKTYLNAEATLVAKYEGKYNVAASFGT